MHNNRVCSSTVERPPHTREVPGSIPGLPDLTKDLNSGTSCSHARRSAHNGRVGKVGVP